MSEKCEHKKAKNALESLRSENRKLKKENNRLKKSVTKLLGALEYTENEEEFGPYPQQKKKEPECPKCGEEPLLISAGPYDILSCTCGWRQKATKGEKHETHDKVRGDIHGTGSGS